MILLIKLELTYFFEGFIKKLFHFLFPFLNAQIDMFCHDDQRNVGYHNFMAPNLQNKKCDYQSVWEVMRKSTDFKNGNSPFLPEGTDTSPNFVVVQPAGSLRIVLVLDTSSSMDVSVYLCRLVSLNHVGYRTIVLITVIYTQSLVKLILLGHNMHGVYKYIYILFACQTKQYSPDYDQLEPGWPNSPNQCGSSAPNLSRLLSCF